MPNNKALEKDLIKLTINDKININSLENNLLEKGFEQVDFTSRPGEFSIRGFIIDIFSFGNENPYRIVLSSDNIENIMTFDADSQLSTESNKNIIIAPNIYDPQKNNENYIFSYLNEKSKIWLEDLEILDKNIEKEIFRELKEFSTVNISNKINENSVNTLLFKSSIQKSFNKNINLLENEIEKNKFKNLIAIQTESQKKDLKKYLISLSIKKIMI